jgi:Kef-type K+ transport system membrane component KefB
MVAVLKSPLALFILQAGLIILSARLMGLLVRRLRQPLVIAEMTAGIMLGPSLLGWLAPTFSAAVFPKASLGLLGMFSQIGLILFMFLIGLELDPKLLRGRGRASVAISHTSIVVPFALGSVLAVYLYPRLAPPGVSFTSFLLFMGVAMSITAFPVLARILVERRLLKTRVGAVTIACAAVDDVTAWCILAFIVSFAHAEKAGSAIGTTAFALAYIAVMFLVVRPLLARLAERSARTGLSQNLVAATLLLLLASSWLTELIGVHALFGAFLFGAMLPKEGGFARQLAEKLEDLVVVFMLPLFFAYSGLRTQVGLLNTADSWGMCGLIVLVACVGKFGGSTVAARLTGLGWREASALGILMNTRGLMELIVLNVGLDLGVISPELFAMMVLMALVTTFATSPLLDWVYPRSEFARELAGKEAELEAVPPSRARLGTAAAPRPRPDYTVLACVRYERSGPPLVTLANALAGNPVATRIYALRLVAPGERGSFVLEQQEEAAEMEATDERALGPMLERARAIGVPVRPLSFVSPRPARDICDVADVKQADIVLLAWHKPILGTILSGTIREVMHDADADVGVLIERGLGEIRRVLVPYLGTEHDKTALRLAHRLARNCGAAITVLHVVAEEGDRSAVDARIREMEAEGPATQVVVRSGHPADAALDEAHRGYDLVLVGLGPEWGLEHRPFAIQQEALLAKCPASVLVVRQRPSTAAEEVTDEGVERSPEVVAAT